MLLTFEGSPDKLDKAWQTPLHAAAASGIADSLTLLFKKEGPIDLQDRSGQTPLHIACNRGRVEVFRALLQNGAKSRLKDVKGNLPIHLAAASGNETLVQELLDYGSPVNPVNADGFSLLYIVVKDLYRCGTNANALDDDGRSPIDCWDSSPKSWKNPAVYSALKDIGSRPASYRPEALDTAAYTQHSDGKGDLMDMDGDVNIPQ